MKKAFSSTQDTALPLAEIYRLLATKPMLSYYCQLLSFSFTLLSLIDLVCILIQPPAPKYSTKFSWNSCTVFLAATIYLFPQLGVTLMTMFYAASDLLRFALDLSLYVLT
jgi:hypothetical protein